jgi:hypothetical protein
VLPDDFFTNLLSAGGSSSQLRAAWTKIIELDRFDLS